MAERRIIIDTDPGIDDAVAILLALGSPELKVEGIVAVAGNLPLGVTERNARAICEFAGRPDIPVYAGCSRPMTRALAYRRAFSRGQRSWHMAPAGAGGAARNHSTASISPSTCCAPRRRKASPGARWGR